MKPYRLWDRKFEDLPKEMQEHLHLPSGNDFWDTVSVEDKKAILKREFDYDPENNEQEEDNGI